MVDPYIEKSHPIPLSIFNALPPIDDKVVLLITVCFASFTCNAYLQLVSFESNN